ncbi:hypothetical protein BsWGS_01408 [Bradybaena similaris]
MALALLFITPGNMLNGLMHVKIVSGMSGKKNEDLERAGKIVVEALGNSKTVASLVIEDHFQQLFVSSFLEQHKRALVASFIAGIMYAISQASVAFIYGFAFYYGAKLIEDYEAEFKDIMMVTTALMFTAMSIGQMIAYAPDFGKAKEAGRRLLAVIETVPSSNTTLDIGYKPAAGTFKSDLRLQDVHFTYRNRPNVKVLQGLTTSIEAGKTVALVGHSGCGKSTVISLLERFYSCDSGSMFLDIYNLEDLNVQWLRTQMALVSQEPTLFNCSIAENIAYGDNSRIIGVDEIIRAARNANIHNFIEALPEGYQTNVGSRGTQLSGGQKQRIAIARALIRNPKILLLDEATSALDTESERLVQQAIDKARLNRTCIVIAHRLSTIVNSDKIVVIDKGVVVEQGTHKELMAKKGAYYKLHVIQNRKR